MPFVQFGLIRRDFGVSGPDSLMGFLGSFGFSFKFPELIIIWAVVFGDELFSDAQGHFRKIQRIGSVVSDLSCFIEPLGDAHSEFRRELESSPRFLLQRACGKRR